MLVVPRRRRKAMMAQAQEQLGVELSSKQASRVKMSALSEQKTKYRESFQRLPSYARVFLDRNEGACSTCGGVVVISSRSISPIKA